MKTIAILGTISLAVGISVLTSTSPAVGRSCTTLENVFSSEDVLRDDAGSWPAYWALFLAEAVGTQKRNRVSQGCAPPPDAPAQVVCSWQFQLGEPTAAATYEDVFSALIGCLGSAATVTRDQGVNHPDYYDAYLIQLPAHRLTLSIKDKSALGITFVTLRVYSEP